MSRRAVSCHRCHRPIQIGKRIESSVLRDDEYYLCDDCTALLADYNIKTSRRTRTITARSLSDTPCQDCGVWLTWADVKHGFTTCASCAAERRAAR